jgi:hypothetical protein
MGLVVSRRAHGKAHFRAIADYNRIQWNAKWKIVFEIPIIPVDSGKPLAYHTSVETNEPPNWRRPDERDGGLGTAAL